MKNKGFTTSTTAMLCILLTATGLLLPDASAWGAPGQAVPPPALLPLNQVAVPEPPNLFQFVKNKPAAIKLGKALFWDMQAGSDGIQACASCHFSAGADSRHKNTVHPGSDKAFMSVSGPNQTLNPTDPSIMPFVRFAAPDFGGVPMNPIIDDIVGSQGVRLAKFLDLIPGSVSENKNDIAADPVFNVPGVGNVRRVTGRNTPSNINAIFNFNNFWDGRAHFIFNGQNPFGPLDINAGIWVNTGTPAVPVLTKQKVTIEFASLASQATGPPLNDTEMSFSGRIFPQLGRKLLGLTPLGQQFVHPGDSVLGSLTNAQLVGNKLSGGKGLKVINPVTGDTGYKALIQDAFQNNLWDATAPPPPAVTPTVNFPTVAVPAPGGELFNQMEANFSLFWGLAIQLYEATLVSDQTPFDRFLGGDQAALTPQQQDGFNIFFGAGQCGACHAGTETTTASVRAAAFLTNAINALIEPMPVASGLQVIYDAGFNNTAVTPTTEDIGRGGNSPFNIPLTVQPLPLSFSQLAVLQAVNNNLLFASPQLPDPKLVNTPVGNDGAFKVPGLRNVALTAPYMHNGGMQTLDQVVDFYTRGGNFPTANRNQLDVAIAPIGALQNNPATQTALIEFMKSMTDKRVENESAPFDHPELLIPEGDPEVLRIIPARDANGVQALPTNFKINPVVSPTNMTTQLISGTKDIGAAILVQANGVAATVTGAPADTTWSATVSLMEENNVILVTSVEATGSTPLNVNILLDTVLPPLTLAAVTTPTRSGTQVISGTVEAGIIPLVKVGTTATVGTVTAGGTSWSAVLSQFVSGPNAVTVTATDSAGNVTTQTATINMLGDGIFNGTRVPDISDALKALRMAVGLITPTADDLLHGDVAPLGAPDGTIDISDALLIMRNVVGTIALIN